MSQTHHINIGDTVTLGTNEPDTPDDIETFLRARGWIQASPRWQHDDKRRYFMTWEQAVAIEFYEFITIGGVPR